MKKWKEDIKGILNIDYVIFKNVPMRKSKWGDVIDVKLEVMEFLAAEAILKQGIALRGKEVFFLRKVLGLSIEKFANKIGLTSASVFKWEKAEDKHLAPINEVAVRTLVAEILGIKLPGQFSKLVGTEVAKKIELKVS